MFSIILLILFIPVCVLLILIVLLQAGKGGGLSGAFGGPSSQTFLGARGAADFLGKLTVYLAIGFMTLSFILSITYGRERKISIKEPKPAAQTQSESPSDEAAKTPEGSATGQTQSPPAGQGTKAPASAPASNPASNPASGGGSQTPTGN